MSDEVSQRVALVTGGSRGIGLAAAHALVAAGARVGITGRHAESLDAALETFPPGTAIAIAGRSDDAAHRRDALDAVTAAFGPIDTLVCNAGINPVYGALRDLDLDAARKTMDVNVLATLAWVQEALRAGLGDERPASVVLVSSVTGQTPSENIGWYGVTKAAVAHMARTLAVELAPGVRVNAVAPAVVKTDFARALYDGRESEVAARYPMGRLGTTHDVAAAIAFLVSDAASWITGQVLTLDGGLLAAGARA